MTNAQQATPPVDNRYVAEGCEKFTGENYVTSLQTLLDRALPMLCKLGDFIGNGEIDKSREDSLGARCDLIGDIKNALKPTGSK